MNFANPHYFYLLLLLFPMIGWYVWKQRHAQASLQVSSTEGFAKAPKSYRIYLRHVPFALRLIAFSLVVTALARPQLTNSWSKSTTEGIDIVLTLDVSTSMLAEDLRPNRIEAAKEVAASFINGRPTDNIGLVIFAGESFTQCPLTTDHTVLLNLLKDVGCGMIEDGTAIGHGLATSVSRLRESKAKSKVIILLTDGTNNRGEIAPLTAADIARTYGIRVYTIGVGTKGEAPYPVASSIGIRYVNMPVDIDEKVLTQIAQITDGLYFRATDNKTLKAIYAEIDQMEKTKLSVQQYSKKQEGYLIFAIAALIAFLLEILLRYTVLKNIP
ncbi:MAG: VWA domain-containing protein [Dysgonamonadaceae bacterium]|jgi:Ca-activated chloride channel family protein|nr:VWA domain-containing protein [Dysgonamonadaceae bacterium]